MRKNVARTLLALAATIPLTFFAAGSVGAQSNYDEDIAVYSQELNARIEQGRNSITPANYTNLRDLWNKIDMIRRQYANKRMGDAERNNMMASLTNLDRQLTENLHDDQNARWQNWDPNKRSWRQNWWQNKLNGNVNVDQYSFNDEIDSYQRDLKTRLDRGRSTGRLSPGEYNKLWAQWGQIDRSQVEYRRGGFNMTERNSLMGMLTQLDRELTAELRDDNDSRYRYWDPNKNTWNQNWWKPGWTATHTPSYPGNTGWNPNGGTPADQNFNEEIDSYQRDLKTRIDRARNSGRLTPNELASLNAKYSEIDRTQQDYRRGGFNGTERNSLMTMLTQLDRDITAQARDDENSRARYWDPNKNTWNQNWWKPGWTATNNPNANPNDNMRNSMQFSEEVNQFQTRLRQEINRGERSGQLTTAEAADLNRQYETIEQLQQQTRQRGFTRGERDNLINQLKSLETKINAATRNTISQESAADRRRDIKEDRRDDRNDRRDDRRGWSNNNNNGAAVNTPVTPPVVTPATPPATTPATTTTNSDANDDRDGRGRGRGRGGRGRDNN
jgi:hypothetical protein